MTPANVCNASVVRAIVAGGWPGGKVLIEWGAKFDREDDQLIFTKEGGHQFPASSALRAILRAGEVGKAPLSAW